MVQFLPYRNTVNAMLQLCSSLYSCDVIVTSIIALLLHGQLKKNSDRAQTTTWQHREPLLLFKNYTLLPVVAVLNTSRSNNTWPSVTQLLTSTESPLHSQSTSLSTWHLTKEITCLEMYKECNYYGTFTFLRMWCSKWLTVSPNPSKSKTIQYDRNCA